ncbi:MAG: DUF2259 domain-containing protein [Treponema sp.]|nr:DUF2259 domain-containing protein [Treponema sp.]MBR4629058.1 DUF2259 domain-containing protein [Treponema sp.]MBR6914477.1 DUF2259 domain-containing protein [Treponema sp.]
MKRLLSGIFFICASFSAFCGDEAAFVDIGFSDDGKTYVFGEYGMTDIDFQGYAEIYTVDVEQNNFVKGGIFRVQPAPSTYAKPGRDVYDGLFKKARWWLRKYNCSPVDSEHVIYNADGLVSGDSEIVFKDLEGSTVEREIFYHIKLIKTIDDEKKPVRSSFFITLEKADGNGHTLSRNIIGSPDVKRQNVVDYKIEKIFLDKSNRSLVFVVAKTLQDKSGNSVRYMVEAIRY